MKSKQVDTSVKYVKNTLLARFNIFQYGKKKATVIVSVSLIIIGVALISSLSLFTAELTLAGSKTIEHNDYMKSEYPLDMEKADLALQQMENIQGQLEAMLLKGLDQLNELTFDDIIAIPLSPATEEQINARLLRKIRQLLGNRYRSGLVLRYAREFQIPPLLVVSLIFTESTNYPYAKSRAGARGLMQLMPETAQMIAKNLNMMNISQRIKQNPDILYDEDLNIHFGCVFLQYLYKELEDWKAVLNAYNMGLGNHQNGRINKIYVERITADWERFEEELQNLPY